MQQGTGWDGKCLSWLHQPSPRQLPHCSKEQWEQRSSGMGGSSSRDTSTDLRLQSRRVPSSTQPHHRDKTSCSEGSTQCAFITSHISAQLILLQKGEGSERYALSCRKRSCWKRIDQRSVI